LCLSAGLQSPTEALIHDLASGGTLDEAADWLHAAAHNLRFAYKLKGKITIEIERQAVHSEGA